MSNVATWMSLADKMSDTFAKFRSVEMPREPGKAVSDVYLLGFSLLARTSSNFNACKMLIRAALIVEARIMARSCIENGFYLVGLLKEGESFVQTMATAEVGSRAVRGQTLMERGPDGLEDDVRTDLARYLKEMRTAWPKARSIEPRKLAPKGPLKDAYVAYGQLSADAAHPSLSSLDRYVSRRGGVATLTFVSTPTNEELADTMTWACIGALAAFITGSELFRAAALNAELSVLAEEYHRLANPA